jgi:S-(hydroxymethyl)glutathione dehydrogenase / alcohol dehydrogenase
MRAAILPALNTPLEVADDITLDEPGPREVKVRIAASGICHSDLSAQNGTLPMPLPCIPGHEGAGEVIAVGELVEQVSLGDHVIIAWLPPCGKCKRCLEGQPHLCLTHLLGFIMDPKFRRGEARIPGFAGTGTFAEEMVVPEYAAIPIPDDVPLDIASLIGCGVMTGVGAAINTAKVVPGSNVVVFGCGGVGISAIQGARIAGAAEIVAVDLLSPKLDLARRFGATHATLPEGLDSLRAEITGGEGFDYAFEVIGTPGTIRAAWDATRRGGTTVVVGAGSATAMVEFSAYELFFMERRLLGSLYGSANVKTDFGRLLRLWREGKLDLEGLITQRIDLSEVNEAFEALKRGEVLRTVIEFK